jgi:hypothetical protein
MHASAQSTLWHVGMQRLIASQSTDVAHARDSAQALAAMQD